MQESDNALRMKQQWDVIHRRNVMNAKDLLGTDVTEHGDLGFRCLLEGLGYDEAARNEVRQETKSAQYVHGRLCRLRLLLTVHVGHERDVDQSEVFVPNTELELAHGLDEGGRLNVTDSAAQLYIS